MPICEYQCPVGHVTSKIVAISTIPVFTEVQRIDCPICFEVENEIRSAYRIWSLPGNVQIGKPTRMFINTKTGEPFSPISEHDKPPKGYREIELKGPIERSKFEKEQQQRTDIQNQLTSYALDSLKEEARKKRHDNLKARMNAVQREEFTDKDGKTKVEEFTLDHKDKYLIEKAMKRSKKRPKREKKSNVMLAVNHYNPSNLDEVK